MKKIAQNIFQAKAKSPLLFVCAFVCLLIVPPACSSTPESAEIAFQRDVDRLALLAAEKLIAFYSGKKIKIYVLPFRDGDDDTTDLGTRVADRIEGRLFFADKFQLVERYDFPDLLDELKLSGWFNSDPVLAPRALKKIAGKLKADALVTGRVLESEKNFIVEARLLDGKSGALLSVGRSALWGPGNGDGQFALLEAERSFGLESGRAYRDGPRRGNFGVNPAVDPGWPYYRRIATYARPGPRDLLVGRWQRVGDAYAGAVIQVYRVRDAYFGTLREVSPGLARWGFRRGLKWKYLRPLGRNTYRGLSLSRGGRRDAFFSGMLVRLSADGRTLVAELEGDERSLDIQGRVQTYVRLP